MSTPDIRIRHGVPKDTPDITELIKELNRLEGYDQSASPSEMADILFHEAGRRISMRALVAEQGFSLIGLVLYYWGYDTVTATTGYHLADIIVTQKKRGRGVGRQMFAALAKQCLHEGGQWVSLTVLKRNAKAKKFYTAMGMVDMGVDFYAIGPTALKQLR